MRPTLSSLTHTAATAFAAYAMERLIPALIAGGAEFLHRLSPDHAEAEFRRRVAK